MNFRTCFGHDVFNSVPRFESHLEVVDPQLQVQFKIAQLMPGFGIAHNCDEMKQQRVQFGSITLRHYPITLGDNPGGKAGPPLTIEWDHILEESLPVDCFEQGRQRATIPEPDVRKLDYKKPCVKINKTVAFPRMTKRERYQALTRAGFTGGEIESASQSASRVREQRRESYAQSRVPLSELAQVLSESFLAGLSGLRPRSPDDKSCVVSDGDSPPKLALRMLEHAQKDQACPRRDGFYQRPQRQGLASF